MPVSADAESAIREALSSQVPGQLTDALVTALSDMIDHYVAGRHRPSELSSGDFAEATVRILQHMATGRHTPLGSTLPRMDAFLGEMENSTLDDSLRIHVPRLVQAIYDVRNRRGVGHLAGAVSANRADAELLLSSAKWIVAELLRLFHRGSAAAAQRVIDALVVRTAPIIQNFEGTVRIVTERRVSLPDATILLIYANEARATSRSDLLAWSGAGGKQLSTAIGRLDDRRMVHRFPDGRVALTHLGERRAEQLMTSLA